MTRPEIVTAVPTLFAADGTLDPTENRRLYESLRGQVDGLFVAGTTGEFPALSDDERALLFQTALDVFGPAAVIAHVGSPATSHAVRLAGQAVALGVRRLAALPPFYFAVDRIDLLRHFQAVVEAAQGAAVYAYLFPERTGVDVSPELLAEIVGSTGVAGAKLSGGAAQTFSAYLDALPAGTPVWSGADTDLVAATAAGGRGVVSGLSAAAPAVFANLATAIERGDAASLADGQAGVDAVAAALLGSPAGIKAGLREQGYNSVASRMAQGPDARVDVEAVRRLFTSA